MSSLSLLNTQQGSSLLLPRSPPPPSVGSCAPLSVSWLLFCLPACLPARLLGLLTYLRVSIPVCMPILTGRLGLSDGQLPSF